VRIAVGSDHAGFDMKELIADHLRKAGHEVEDLGTHDAVESVDYPLYGAAVGRAVSEGTVDLGFCSCGTGIGIAIAANKIPGIRAAVVHDVTTATLAREHNHANVVCIGGRTTGNSTALDSVDAFLASSPQPGRHDRRVAELADLDEQGGQT
jgi:ribose 5-phosphate isomerase B